MERFVDGVVDVVAHILLLVVDLVVVVVESDGIVVNKIGI